MANNRELSQFASVVGNNGGNIGIGTDNPGNVLHLQKNGGDAILELQNSGNGNHSGIFFVRESSGGVNKGAANIHVESNTSGSASALVFGCGSNISPTGSERLRIDSSGRLLVGTTSSRSVSSLNSSLQVEGTGGDSSTISVTRNVASAAPPRVVFGKSRGTSLGSSIVVQSGDSLGEISFSGADGTDANSVAATINCKVDGTPGSNDMPGRIMFHTTADGASTPTERLRITSGGNIGVGENSPDRLLHIKGASSTAYSGGSDTADYNFLKIENTTNDKSAGIFFLIGGNGEAAITATEVSDGNTDIAFQNRGGGTRSEKLRIDSGGRLMVQCTSDSSDSLLIVQGNAGDSGTGGQISIQRGGNANPTAPSDLGGLMFKDSAGSRGAVIAATCDGDWASNDYPTRLEFKITPDNASSPETKMRIDSAGRVQMANAGSFYSDGEALSVSTSNNGSVQVMRNTNASFGNSLIFGYSSRSNNSAFQFAKFASSAASDTEFVLRGDGNGYADGSWNGGGADYAEYFEWSDGNTGGEDRRGISVVLDGDKIREAVAGEEPIGVISGNPSVVGDADIDRWKHKYLRDDYGSYLWEDYEVEDEDGNTVVQQRRQINPAWNSENEYVSREDRPEWDTVGLMGKLRIRKGQVTGTRWVKMRDVSDTVEEWLLR